MQYVPHSCVRSLLTLEIVCQRFLSRYNTNNIVSTHIHRSSHINSMVSGLMLPLTTANLLAPAIVGSALENMDIERLIREVGLAVAERVHGNNESVDDVAKELHEKLLLRNESTKRVVIENIYRELPEAMHNVQVWMNSPNIQAARPQLKKVRQPCYRFMNKYFDPFSLADQGHPLY